MSWRRIGWWMQLSTGWPSWSSAIKVPKRGTPLMNDFVSLQKDVALISLIGPIEILRQAGIDKSKYANFTPYVGAAIIFLLLTIPETRFVDHLMTRERRRTSGTAVR
jgi:polar amino acid transport system permease protein